MIKTVWKLLCPSQKTQRI